MSSELFSYGLIYLLSILVLAFIISYLIREIRYLEKDIKDYQRRTNDYLDRALEAEQALRELRRNPPYEDSLGPWSPLSTDEVVHIVKR